MVGIPSSQRDFFVRVSYATTLPPPGPSGGVGGGEGDVRLAVVAVETQAMSTLPAPRNGVAIDSRPLCFEVQGKYRHSDLGSPLEQESSEWVHRRGLLYKGRGVMYDPPPQGGTMCPCAPPPRPPRGRFVVGQSVELPGWVPGHRLQPPPPAMERCPTASLRLPRVQLTFDL
ncbi:hypothetical protein NHX12_008741 [Muraenolepis orangiensis]|uniref:Uncharacterized protein n=1 Tax=Muraenolepis orangiensis TaxID=630683 RepID=A0A9Q0DNN8_9TELE|nr:hypothetical protein NHX12_008741 [Muraenolepis orangiensis]